MGTLMWGPRLEPMYWRDAWIGVTRDTYKERNFF